MKKTYLKILQLPTKQVNFANTNKHWNKHFGKNNNITLHSTNVFCVVGTGLLAEKHVSNIFKYILCFKSHCRWHLNCKPSSAGGIKAVCLMDPNWSWLNICTPTKKNNSYSSKKKTTKVEEENPFLPNASLLGSPCHTGHSESANLRMRCKWCPTATTWAYARGIVGIATWSWDWKQPTRQAQQIVLGRNVQKWTGCFQKIKISLNEWSIYNKKHTGVLARVETIGHFDLATCGNINLLTVHLTPKWGRY